MPSRLPDIATLPDVEPSELTGILDLLFEPSEHLHELALTMKSMRFGSYPELIDTLRDVLLDVQAKVRDDPIAHAPLLSILGSHPRLGEKKVHSAQSQAEQAAMNNASAAGQDGEAQAQALARLNTEYEEKFPGLRYVVFVNGRGRDVIMENMRARIDRGDFDAEEKEAIQAMCDIAKDRAAKLLQATAN